MDVYVTPDTSSLKGAETKLRTEIKEFRQNQRILHDFSELGQYVLDEQEAKERKKREKIRRKTQKAANQVARVTGILKKMDETQVAKMIMTSSQEILDLMEASGIKVYKYVQKFLVVIGKKEAWDEFFKHERYEFKVHAYWHQEFQNWSEKKRDLKTVEYQNVKIGACNSTMQGRLVNKYETKPLTFNQFCSEFNEINCNTRWDNKDDFQKENWRFEPIW